MSTFPLELIRAVVDNIVSTSELKTLRKVSRTFNTLATPGVFRVLHVTVLSDSVQRLESVHKSDVLRHFVEEVVFQYADTESDDEDIESEASDSETRSVKVTRVENLEGDDKWKGYRDEELRAYEAEQDETTDDESTTDGSEGGNSDGGSTERDEEFVEEVNFAQLFGRSTPQGMPVFLFLINIGSDYNYFTQPFRSWKLAAKLACIIPSRQIYGSPHSALFVSSHV